MHSGLVGGVSDDLQLSDLSSGLYTNLRQETLLYLVSHYPDV